MTRNNLDCLAGKKYGRITLLEYVGVKRHLSRYNAVFDCGTSLNGYAVAKHRGLCAGC